MKESLDAIGKIVDGDIADIRTKMSDEKDHSSTRFAELKTQHEKALDDLDKLQEKVDSIQVAVNSVSASKEDEKGMSEDVREHKQAFDKYLRTCENGNLKELEKKTLSIGSDPDGGFLAPEEMSNMVIKTIYETSTVRPAVSVESTSKAEKVYLVDRDEAGAEWVAEGGVNSNTKTPQIEQLRLQAHKLATEPAATAEILEDADINMESWLAAKVGEKFARTQNSTFVLGDGVGKPRGLLTYTAGSAWGEVEQVATSAANAIDELDLIELHGSLKTPYLSGASYAMSRQTNKAIRMLQDANGQFIFQGQDLQGGTLYGYAVHKFDDMSGPTSGVSFSSDTLPIIFGNLKTAYTIIDRVGISVLRDPFTSKGFVKFYTTMRVGGGVLNFEAYKILKVA